MNENLFYFLNQKTEVKPARFWEDYPKDPNGYFPLEHKTKSNTFSRLKYPTNGYMDILTIKLGIDLMIVDDASIMQVGLSKRKKHFINEKGHIKSELALNSLKTDKKLIHGFYVGFWRDRSMHYTRKVFPVLTCLKDIGGMNAILTLIGNWLNFLFCAGLVKVYIAEAYSQISKYTGSVQYTGGCMFKFKSILRNHMPSFCRFDKDFEDEKEHVEEILKEL
jgi:hypothetical protein